MRVVFDTNVLVAALVFPDGRADAAVRRIIEGKDDLVLSMDILREVLSVLARKFWWDKEELSRVAVILSEMAEVVEPTTRLKVFRDDPDNRILECAVAGKATAIVTGDKAMLALGKHAGVRLISLSEYLSRR
jgi:putative PIN family toxin of toxin-antitoxin system